MGVQLDGTTRKFLVAHGHGPWPFGLMSPGGGMGEGVGWGNLCRFMDDGGKTFFLFSFLLLPSLSLPFLLSLFQRDRREKV